MFGAMHILVKKQKKVKHTCSGIHCERFSTGRFSNFGFDPVPLGPGVQGEAKRF